MKKFSNISTSQFKLNDSYEVIEKANKILAEISGDKINFSDKYFIPQMAAVL